MSTQQKHNRHTRIANSKPKLETKCRVTVHSTELLPRTGDALALVMFLVCIVMSWHTNNHACKHCTAGKHAREDVTITELSYKCYLVLLSCPIVCP